MQPCDYTWRRIFEILDSLPPMPGRTYNGSIRNTQSVRPSAEWQQRGYPRLKQQAFKASTQMAR
jgi:hypothetical protein